MAIRLNALLIASALASDAAWAGQCELGGTTWSLEGFSNFSDGDFRLEISGMACGPGSGDGASSYCVVAQDEDSEFLIGSRSERTLDMRGTAKLTVSGEFDAEAATYFDGAYYVPGSHSVKAKSCKANAAASLVAKVTLSGDGMAQFVQVQTSKRLGPIVSGLPELSAYAGQCLGTVDPDGKKGDWTPARGINIEAMAIDSGTAYFGLRGPVLSDQTAYVMAVELNALFGEGEAKARAYPLKLGENRGIRDMALVDGQFLLLSGSQDDDKGGAAIFSWQPGGVLTEICSLDPAVFSEKPEALVAMPFMDGKTHLLVLSDGAMDGDPREIVIAP